MRLDWLQSGVLRTVFLLLTDRGLYVLPALPVGPDDPCVTAASGDLQHLRSATMGPNGQYLLLRFAVYVGSHAAAGRAAGPAADPRCGLVCPVPRALSRKNGCW